MAEVVAGARFLPAETEDVRLPVVVGGPGAEVQIPVLLVGSEGMALEAVYGALLRRRLAVSLAVGDVEAAAELAVKVDARICLLINDSPVNTPEHTRSIRRLVEYGKRVLVLSRDGATDDMISAGASGIVDKDMGLEGLVRAIRGIHFSQVLPGYLEPALIVPTDTLWFEAPFKQLSGRERDCLVLLYQGKATPEITEALGITLATTRRHISNLLAKLNVHSRLEAVAMVARYYQEI